MIKAQLWVFPSWFLITDFPSCYIIRLPVYWCGILNRWVGLNHLLTECVCSEFIPVILCSWRVITIYCWSWTCNWAGWSRLKSANPIREHKGRHCRRHSDWFHLFYDTMPHFMAATLCFRGFCACVSPINTRRTPMTITIHLVVLRSVLSSDVTTLSSEVL